MAFGKPTAATTLAASITLINDSLDALFSLNYGASEPAGKVAGTPWIDSGTDELKIYDGSSWVVVISDVTVAGGEALQLSGGTMTGNINMGSNAVEGLPAPSGANDAVRKAAVDARSRVVAIPIGAVSSSQNIHILAGMPACDITKVTLVDDTALANHATNYWDFTVQNLTEAVTVVSDDTTATGITADTGRSLGAISDGDLAADDVIELQITANGSPTALSNLVVFVTYTESV